MLLLWNLRGVGAWIRKYSADVDQLAKSDPYTVRIFAAMPAWAWLTYVSSVGVERWGAILLLLRNAAAAPLFLLSILAVIVQFGHSFLGTDLPAAKGFGAATFSAVILIVALIQRLYARALIAKGVNVVPSSRASWVSVLILSGMRLSSAMRSGRISCRTASASRMTTTPSASSVRRAGKSSAILIGT